MIDVFVRAELASGRFGEKLRGILEREGLAVDDPGAIRLLFDEHRMYGIRYGLFEGFPQDVAWWRAEVTRDELLDVLFIKWDWWLTISGGTRSARETARRIRAGEVPGSDVEEHEPFVARPQPPLIVVSTPDRSKLVLLEGHVRLTAYAVFPDRVGENLEILLGVSDEMPRWAWW